MGVPPQQAFTPQHILVVTLADLGDALLTTPALLALRQALPKTKITILTTTAGAAALRDLNMFDDLLLFDKNRFNRPLDALHFGNLLYGFKLWQSLRAGRFDSCILLQHFTTRFSILKYAALVLGSGASRRYGLDNGRGFFLTDRVIDHGFGKHHQAEYWLSVVELIGASTRPAATYRIPSSTPSVETILPIRSDAPLVAVHPGSGSFAPARRWSPQRFAALADALIDDGAQLVLVGGAEESDLRHSMLSSMRHSDAVQNLGGRTSLAELTAVLQQCDLFVGNDSGVSHVASCVGTPVVAVFGPTDPHAWGPYGGEAWTTQDHFPNGVAVLRSGPHRALWADLACSPCLYRGHTLGTPNGCPDKTCLRRVETEQLLQVVRQRLRELSSTSCVSTI